MSKNNSVATPSRPIRILAMLLCVLTVGFVTIPAHAQAPEPQTGIQGTVVNGTTQKPVANAPVDLVFMMRGTTPVESVKTDSSGHFRLNTAPPGGGAPALIRVQHEGATYSHPLMPGQPASDVKVEVFEASHDKGIVSEKDHAIYLHPSGDTLMVLEQIWLENESNPPKAFVSEKATYTFHIPKAKEAVKATVVGPGGMPISQPVTAGAASDSYSIDYPIRPGETQVRLEYGIDYKSPYSFTKTFDTVPGSVQLVTPGKGVTLTADNLAPLGTDPESGFMGYKAPLKNNRLSVSVSGDVPQAASPAMGAEGEESTSLTPIPDQVSNNRLIILTGFGILLLGGFIYHFRQT